MPESDRETSPNGCLWAVLIVFGAFGFYHLFFGGDRTPDAGAERPATSAKAPCGKDDLQCWGDRYAWSAGHLCADRVERLAKYELKWEDTWTQAKFYQFRWANPEHSAITMIGDRAKASNAFGAFRRLAYECDMSVPGETVLNVRVKPAR